MPSIVSDAFKAFPKEAEIIGRLLTGYSNLEIDLMNCIRWATSLDAALKVMYRARGETARINVADALGRPYYASLGIGTEYERAIGAMRYCLKIRNQFSHCIWWDDRSGRLAFADLEELADLNVVVTDLRGLTTLYVDIPLLEAQEAFFVNTDSLMLWINYEGRRRAGQPSTPGQPAPRQIPRPPLHIP
jgi:hypothetical protein